MDKIYINNKKNLYILLSSQIFFMIKLKIMIKNIYHYYIKKENNL